jgi:transcriptional regulator with XRE-family HTH domain
MGAAPMSRSDGNGRVIRAASASGPLKVEPLKLGERIREIRRRNAWTLEDASQRTGLARSTLSKIENEQMSPTFEVVQKLAAGLEIELPQLFEAAEPSGATGRRTITRSGEGRPRVTTTYEHELLSVELARRKMIPFKTRVRARSFDEFTSWVRHPGEEFLYVLEGSIAFYTEFYEAVVLAAGDSVYYDSDMGHACVSVSDEDALILWVSTG